MHFPRLSLSLPSWLVFSTICCTKNVRSFSIVQGDVQTRLLGPSPNVMLVQFVELDSHTFMVPDARAPPEARFGQSTTKQSLLSHPN